MRLMLAITNRCNKTCAHCCFSSSPQDNRGLSLEEMRGYIDEVAAVSGKSADGQFEVRFQGGEPFLRFDDLLETVRYAGKRGAKRIGGTTNSFWAVSLPEARRKMNALKSAGMTNIRLSCDEFHHSLEGIDPLRNAFIAAVEANVSVGLKMVVYRDSIRAAEILRLLGDVTRDIIFYIEELSLLPVGRARELPENMFLKCDGLPSNTWCDLLKTFVVDYEQNVWPCCSPFRENLLRLGNTRRESLSTLIDKAGKNSLFQVLAREGPIFFIPFLEKAGLTFPPGAYINRCHLCREMLKAADSSSTARNGLKEAVNAWENEQSRMNSVLEIVENLLADPKRQMR